MHSRNHCCRGSAITITHSESISVAIVVQLSKCMRRITLSSVAGQSYRIVPQYLTNGRT